MSRDVTLSIFFFSEGEGIVFNSAIRAVKLNIACFIFFFAS